MAAWDEGRDEGFAQLTGAGRDGGGHGRWIHLFLRAVQQQGGEGGRPGRAMGRRSHEKARGLAQLTGGARESDGGEGGDSNVGVSI